MDIIVIIFWMGVFPPYGLYKLCKKCQEVYEISKIRKGLKEEAEIRRLEEEQKALREERVKRATEIRVKVLDMNNICARNYSFSKPVISITYMMASQMSIIMEELTELAERQGRIDSLIEELNESGGIIYENSEMF